jgi:molecular chaperone DnaJ
MDNFRDDYYQILGVSETSSFSEIREKYILLSKKNHPDQAGSERLMQIINEAYAVLGNASKKAAYDEFLKNSRTKSKFKATGTIGR